VLNLKSNGLVVEVILHDYLSLPDSAPPLCQKPAEYLSQLDPTLTQNSALAGSQMVSIRRIFLGRFQDVPQEQSETMAT
jgi:hypothetical protein